MTIRQEKRDEIDPGEEQAVPSEMKWTSICAVILFWAATNAVAQMGPSPVVTAPVTKQAVELTQPLVANIEAVTRSTLAAEQDGLAAERFFEEGQVIEKGATLVRLNTDLLEAERAAAIAARDSAIAKIDQARVEAENTRSELARIQKLRQGSVATEKEFRDAEAADKVAQALVTVRQAELAEKDAALRRTDLNLRKADVRSMMAGVISKRYVEIGQWIKQGDPVADIVQLDPLWVKVNVPESVIARVKKGDNAWVTVNAMGGKKLVGKVDQILPQGEASSRTFAVKVLVPNPSRDIWPGFFARIVLTSSSESSVLVIPRDAIVTQGVQSHVIAARDGKAVIVPVVIDGEMGTEVIVSGDLKEGESIVVRGNEQLRGGEPLMVLNNQSSQATSAAKGG